MEVITGTRFNNHPSNRRQFIATAVKATSAAIILQSPFATYGTPSPKEMTVGEVMDLFTSEVKGAPFADTVDTLKSGNRDIKVTGIVTTMFATVDVIRKTIELGANFIIAHEPTFYSHQDKTTWLENDDVYRYKADLLKKHKIAVWRNHDYIHAHVPDGVMQGVLAKLGWGNAYNVTDSIVSLPAMPLRSLIQHTKEKLGIPMLRYAGDLSQSCKRILLMPGAYGGDRHITGISKYKPDVLICGEISEWETAEYVRDAISKGEQLSLIVLGHIASEEPGSIYMMNWVKEKIPGMKVAHIPAKKSLSFL